MDEFFDLEEKVMNDIFRSDSVNNISEQQKLLPDHLHKKEKVKKKKAKQYEFCK